MPLTITRRLQQAGLEVMTLTGRMTLGEDTGQLRDVLKKAIERDSDVLIDLSGLDYIDSAGLGELVGGYASAASKGRTVKLLRPGKRLTSLLQITKLYATFEVFDDEATAIASFSLTRG